MNIKAAGMIGIYLLRTGGVQAVSDTRTLVNAYLGLSSGKASFSASLTTPLLDAVERTLKLLVGAVGDDGQRANLVALVDSL
jgi:hypothetical protein